MSRTLKVVRMQLVNRYTYIWIPLIVLGGSFGLSLLVCALIPSDAAKYTGASQAPLWYFLVVGVQALTLTFPFSQAMSVTRREYFAGTLATAAITSAILAVVFVAGGAVEGATRGWGLNAYYFRLPWVGATDAPVSGLIYFVLAMLLFVAGFAAATVYKRYGAVGVTLALIGVGLVLVGLVWTLTVTDAWGGLAAALVAVGPVGVAGLGIALAALLAAASFVTLRRAIP